MIDEKYIELMNRSLDGDITSDEKEELTSYLETNKDAGRCFEEFQAISHMFNKCNAIAPPPQVRTNIMKTIRRETETPVTHTRSVASIGFLAGLKQRFMPKYVYVFASGLVLGIFLFAILSQLGHPRNESDLAKMYGTIGQTDSGESAWVIDPFEFILPDIHGKARFQCADQHIFVSINLIANKEVELIMEYADGMEFEGFRTLDISDHDLAITGNRVALSHTGVSDYIVVFKKTTSTQASINVKLFSSGELIFEESSVPRRK